MKFDPITKDIFTDEGEFLKKMNCPYKIIWDNLEATSSIMRKCANCDHLIVDTNGLTDDQLIEMIKQNPTTCFKIDLDQPNLKIVTNGIFGQK